MKWSSRLARLSTLPRGLLFYGYPPQETEGPERHTCPPENLVPDSTEPEVSWCKRCGACIGQPGGRRQTVDLGDGYH